MNEDIFYSIAIIAVGFTMFLIVNYYCNQIFNAGFSCGYLQGNDDAITSKLTKKGNVYKYPFGEDITKESDTIEAS